MAISYRHAGYGRQAKSLRNLNFVSMIALFIWATLPFGYFGVGYVQFPGVEPCLMEQIAVKYGWAHVLLANNLNHLLMLLKFRVTCFTKPKPIANVKPALALSSFFALLVSLMMLSEILVLISGFHIEKFAGGVHCEVYLLSSIFTTAMVSLEVPIVCLGIYLFSLPFLSLYSLGRVHSSPAATLGHMEVSSAALQHRQSHPTLTATNSSSNLVERRPQLPPHIRRPLLLNLIGVLVCQLSIIVSALFCFVIPGPGDFPLAHHLQEELMPAIVACNCLGICVMFGDPIYVLRELDHALDRLISSRAFSLTAPVQRSAAAAAAVDRPRRPHHPYAAPAPRRAPTAGPRGGDRPHRRLTRGIFSSQGAVFRGHAKMVVGPASPMEHAAPVVGVAPVAQKTPSSRGEGADAHSTSGQWYVMLHAQAKESEGHNAAPSTAKTPRRLPPMGTRGSPPTLNDGQWWQNDSSFLRPAGAGEAKECYLGQMSK